MPVKTLTMLQWPQDVKINKVTIDQCFTEYVPEKDSHE